MTDHPDILSGKRTLFTFLLAVIIGSHDGLAQLAAHDTADVARLHEIENMFYKNRTHAQDWWYGWLVGYSVATAGQGVVYLAADDKSTRQDMALGAATTFLGAMGQVFAPLVPRNSSYHDVQEMKNSSPEKYADPKYYEEMLQEIVKREKAGRSWKMHVVSGAVNLGSGIITWKGFHRTFTEGVINFAMNTVVTEAQILSIPRKAGKDYEKYLKKYNEGGFPKTYYSSPEYILSAFPGGISLRIDF